MHSDGYLKLNTQGHKAHQICIAVSAKDVEWLRCIASSIQYDGPLYEYSGKAQGGISHKVAALTFSSPRIAHDLVKEGYQHKDDHLPEVPEEYFHHFCRGFFDGDGSVFLTKRGGNNYTNSSFTGTISVLEGFRQRIGKMAGCSTEMVLLQKSNSLNCFSLRYGQSDTVKLYQFLYRDATIYLKRKKEIFEGGVSSHTSQK
jgi:hypothetical protein